MRQIVVSQTGTGSTNAVPLDIHGRPEISLQVVASGVVNYTVEQTLDNPFTTAVPTWFPVADTNLVAATTSKSGGIPYVQAAVRVTVNSGTGSATLTVVQAGDNRA